MNKIIIKNDTVKILESDDSILIDLHNKLDEYDVTSINIDVLKNTVINIEYENNSKIDFKLYVREYVDVTINEIKKESDSKIQNKYCLDKNSKLEINKFYDVYNIKELDLIHLNGINSIINYNFKVISKNINRYDIITYHNNEKTTSNINNKGVTILDGSLKFNVTSIVYNKIKGCKLEEKNHIINMNDSTCEINPNLLIEEEDVIANHSAYIGKFKEELIFYLESRGIDRKDAINLLIKGFLYDKNENINKILSRYWG